MEGDLDGKPPFFLVLSSFFFFFHLQSVTVSTQAIISGTNGKPGIYKGAADHEGGGEKKKWDGFIFGQLFLNMLLMVPHETYL